MWLVYRTAISRRFAVKASLEMPAARRAETVLDPRGGEALKFYHETHELPDEIDHGVSKSKAVSIVKSDK